MKRWIFTLFIIYSSLYSNAQVEYTLDTLASPTCFGAGNGAIIFQEIDIPGQIDRYEWNDGSNNQDLVYISGGSYFLTIYNTEGEAFTTDTFYVDEPDSLMIEDFVSSPTANESNNGFIEVYMRGGTAPYSIEARSAEDTISVTFDSVFTLLQVDTGFLQIIATDVNGCTTQKDYNISARPCQLLVTYDLVPTECASHNSGSIELFPEKEVLPLTVQWSNGQNNTLKIDMLSEGSYTVTLSDKRNCIVTDSFYIHTEDVHPPENVILRKNLRVFLNAEGLAALKPENVFIRGSDRCNDDISFGMSQSVFTCEDLGLNEVDFSVIDGVGNANIQTIMVEVIDSSDLEFIFQDTVITSICNGKATYEQPLLSGICQTTNDIQLIGNGSGNIDKPGTYLDKYYYVPTSGDTMWAEVTVIVKDSEVRAFLNTQPPQCNKGTDGYIAVALRNSTQPITYEWSDGSTEDYIYGIYSNHTYSVRVLEGSGCVFNLSATVLGPDSLSVSLDEVFEHDGNIDISVNIKGGTPPYSYSWLKNGVLISSSATLTNAEDDQVYTLVVKDNNDCIGNTLVVDRTISSNTTYDELNNKIQIYPNPGSINDKFFIRITDDFAKINKIEIYDSNLKILKTLTSEITPEMSISLPPSAAGGLLFLRFITETGDFITKKYLQF